MQFAVQEEDLESVREDAVAILGATRTTKVDESRMKWLYESNPHGPAVFWSIRDTSTGTMAGFTVCLPRRVLVNGETKTCWNGADFSILPKFRTLGVALKLRRAAKLAIDDGRADLLYSHPNARMQLIHQRVGHFEIGEMLRWAKPLRMADYLGRKMPSWLAGVGGLLADPFVTFTMTERMHRLGSRTEVRRAEFDDRYDRLFAEVGPCRPILGVRDADYLNWRYRQNPLESFQTVEAQKGSKLAGYLVFREDKSTVHVKDVFAENDRAVLDLFVTLLRWARKRNRTSASFTVLEGSPFTELLGRLGFRKRQDKSNMFGYARDDSEPAALIRSPESWFITVGDRDV